MVADSPFAATGGARLPRLLLQPVRVYKSANVIIRMSTNIIDKCFFIIHLISRPMIRRSLLDGLYPEMLP